MTSNTQETIIAGNTSLTMTGLGTLVFNDVNGNETRIDGNPLIRKLFEAIRDGSGERSETARKEGKSKPHNIESVGLLTPAGNGFTGYFGGGSGFESE